MKKIMFNLSKANMTSVIALIFVLGFVIMNTLSMFLKPTDKEIALITLNNTNSIVAFVAGYYFNKKVTSESGKAES